MKIELTDREAELLDDYVFRKIRNLEISGLTDVECYNMFMNVHRQIAKSHLQTN